jgi:F0F1-type ATP synthase membrane subunit b/b'
VRRLVLLTFCFAGLFLICGVTPAHAQDAQEYSNIDKITPLKWANSLIFFIGLGYLIYRYGPAFFNARSADIQKAIEEATGLKLQGEFRRSEADRRMATIPAEIAKIQRQHDEALAREYDRVQQDTRSEVLRIHSNVTSEIAALRKEEALRIRQRTAAAAVALAECHLQKRVALDGSNDLDDFLFAVQTSNENGPGEKI